MQSIYSSCSILLLAGIISFSRSMGQEAGFPNWGAHRLQGVVTCPYCVPGGRMEAKFRLCSFHSSIILTGVICVYMPQECRKEVRTLFSNLRELWKSIFFFESVPEIELMTTCLQGRCLCFWAKSPAWLVTILQLKVQHLSHAVVPPKDQKGTYHCVHMIIGFGKICTHKLFKMQLVKTQWVRLVMLPLEWPGAFWGHHWMGS